jgi:hypothetical protein
MTKKRPVKIAVAIAALFLFSGEAIASKSCPTRAEARAANKGAYLYWHRGDKGARCWSTRRVSKPSSKARRVAAQQDEEEKAPTPPHRVEPPPRALPPTYYPQILRFPPDQPPIPLDPELTKPKSIFDLTPFASEAYASSAEPEGPQLPPAPVEVNRASKGPFNPEAARVTADMIMVLVAVWLICCLLGAWFYKWAQRDRDLQRGWMLIRARLAELRRRLRALRALWKQEAAEYRSSSRRIDWSGDTSRRGPKYTGST